MGDRQSACDLLIYRTYLETWRKGEKYTDEGRVEITKLDDKEIAAIVKGTKPYQTRLAFRGGGLSRKCSCPVSDFCKHLVALAIVWDERRGLPRYTPQEIEENAIPPPLVSRAQINHLYQDPLNADLEVLRLAASESGSWSRPHARLPNAPHFSSDPSQPVTVGEVKKAWSEIRRWMRKSNYDPYFCAGEIVAAFCEVVRLVTRRLGATDGLELAKVLRNAQIFHYEIIQQLIDDSDGLHLFTETHLEDMFAKTKNQKTSGENRTRFERLLEEFTRHRDDY